MTTNRYLSGNYAPVTEEQAETTDLTVVGALPPELAGHLLRIGPNPVKVEDAGTHHWFSGDGMVHSVKLRDGKAVAYRNRWVRTRKLAGQIPTPEPLGPIEAVNGPANANVVAHAGRILALSDSGLPHEIDVELRSLGVYDFEGSLSSPMCSHPKKDPANGELLFFGVDVYGPPYLRSHVADHEGTLVRRTEIELPRPVMMHDFAVTGTRMAFLDLPVPFDPVAAMNGQAMPYAWSPDAPARIGVTRRSGRDTAVTWLTVDPCYVLHVLNAFDDGDDLVLDVVRYDRFFDTAADDGLAPCPGYLTRWRVDLTNRRVVEQQIDDVPVEFPRIDDRLTGRPHRYGYCVRMSGDVDAGGSMGDPVGLVKYDLRHDTSQRFDPAEGGAISEPVFVPSVEGRNEDEGWLLTVAFDPDRGASNLLVLDGTSFSSAPVAVVQLPARVPNGFHGTWLADGT